MTLNEIATAYARAKAERADAEKREKYYKSFLEQAANGREHFETEDNHVFLTLRTREDIDRKALYADFPDAKDVYGKKTTYYIIDVKEKTDAEKASAMPA